MTAETSSQISWLKYTAKNRRSDQRRLSIVSSGATARSGRKAAVPREEENERINEEPRCRRDRRQQGDRVCGRRAICRVRRQGGAAGARRGGSEGGARAPRQGRRRGSRLCLR